MTQPYGQPGYPGYPAPPGQPGYPAGPGATGLLAGPPNPPEYATPILAWAAAPPPPKSVAWKRILLLVAIVGFIAVCGVAMVLLVGASIGLVPLIVGVLSAILPVPLLVFAFVWLDRYQPAPTKYLVFCFTWGAFVATLVALLVNTSAGWLFGRFGLPEALVAVFIAPVIEETMKAAGPLLLFWRRRRTISGVIDAIVYCGLSATGFAFVENILYLGGFGYASNAEHGGPLRGAQGVVLLFFGRIVLTGFAHPLFTSMTAIGIGVASRAGSRGVRWLAPVCGLLIAMMLHGTWNLMATLVEKTGQPLIFLYGYFSVMVPIFLGMVGYTLWVRGAEGRLALKILPEYARAGWLSPPEVATLGTIGRRLAARRWAKRVAGDPGAKAMRAYQFDLTRLALLRDGLWRGLATTPGEIEATRAEERRLLDAVAAYRRVFAGRDTQAPRAVWDGHRYHVTFPDGVVRTLPEPEKPVVPVPVWLGPWATAGVPPLGYR